MSAKRKRRAKEEAPAEPKAAKLTFEPLDGNSFTPLYFQIQMQLLKMINTGQFVPGDLLPGEQELTHIYGVSRMTSRQALLGLKNQGHAYRQKGRGTFVSEPKVEKNIAHLLGFSAEMRELGLKPSSRLLKIETGPAFPEIADRLGIEAGSPAISLHRLRLADGIPVVIEEVHLSQHQFPGIEKVDFVRNSLYEALHEHYGVRIGAADEVIEARPASRQEAELLNIAPRSTLLVISRTLLSVEGKPIETGLSLYRGDRYRAVVRVLATKTI